MFTREIDLRMPARFTQTSQMILLRALLHGIRNVPRIARSTASIFPVVRRALLFV